MMRECDIEIYNSLHQDQDWCDIDMTNIRRDASFKMIRNRIRSHINDCRKNPDVANDARKWESIAVTSRVNGFTLAMNDAEKKHALTEVTMLMTTFFNASVLCLPGTATQHGFDEQWNIEGKAYVTSVFASWGIPVVETEDMISGVTWFKDQMSMGIILNTAKNVKTIATSLLSCQKVGNLFRKQLPGGVQCSTYQNGFTGH